jgi:hypothetical protein
VGEPLYKGNGFNGAVKMAKTLFAGELWDEIFAGLPSDARRLVEAPPLATDWVPYTCVDAVYEGIVRWGYGGDEARYVEFAQARIQQDLRGIYRVFIKAMSPSFIIARAGRMYAQYSQNNGAVFAEPGEREVNVYLRGAQVLPGWIRHGMVGTIQAALECSRVTAAKTSFVSTTPDGAHWRATWQ